MKESRAHSQPPQWFWIAAIWSGVGLLNASQTVFVMRAEGMHHAWTKLFITEFLEWLPWALATPFVFRLSRRCPPVKLRPLSTWVRHLCACIAIDFFYSAWAATLEKLLNPWAYSPDSGNFFGISR
jgi:two-component system, LytTR family, sensor kinase